MAAYQNPSQRGSHSEFSSTQQWLRFFSTWQPLEFFSKCQRTGIHLNTAVPKNPSQHSRPSESFSTGSTSKSYSTWHYLRILLNTTAHQIFDNTKAFRILLTWHPSESFPPLHLLRFFPTWWPLRFFSTLRPSASFWYSRPWESSPSQSCISSDPFQ